MMNNTNYNFINIDDPGKAYSLGFILCNSAVDIKKNVTITVSEYDKCILYFKLTCY